MTRRRPSPRSRFEPLEREPEPSERRALLMRIEGALSHSRRSIAREALREAYEALGGCKCYR